MVQRGRDAIVQALVRWNDSLEDLATWEDLDSLKQRFPRAPAWGQAVSKEAGIVSNPQPVADKELGLEAEEGGPRNKSKRERRLPARLADPIWVR